MNHNEETIGLLEEDQLHERQKNSRKSESRSRGRQRTENEKDGTRYYSEEIETILRELNTNVDTGLTEQEAKERRKKYGPNELPKPPPPSLLKMFIKQLMDFMVLILLAAAIASFSLGDYIEGGVLIAVVATNITIGLVEEWKAERALLELKELSVPSATVIRESERSVIPSAQVTVGDIIYMEEGVQIPADIRFTECINLQTVEAALTGESAPVDKDPKPIHSDEVIPIADRHNMGYMSTNVARGRGKGVVVRIGKKTQVGRITLDIGKKDGESNQTLLQQRLQYLGKVLVFLSIFLCAIIVGVSFLRRYLDYGSISGESVRSIITVGVSLAVSVIPEGLVAVVTVTMAFGVKRMAKRNSIVRKLPAVETLGSVTTICADKTGTLTEGIMKAEEILVEGKKYTFTGAGQTPDGKLMYGDKEMTPADMSDALKLALTATTLCNNAVLQKDQNGEWESHGDPTEVAMLMTGYKGGHPKDELLQHSTFLFEIPFDSIRKMMSVGFKDRNGDTTIWAKGATAVLIDKCTHAIDNAGQKIELSQSVKTEIERHDRDMASRGLRVLGVAFKQMGQHGCTQEDAEKELVFLGLVGLYDPPREGVQAMIHRCNEAGINVVMITGDNHLTAKAIAIELGIIKPGKEKGTVMKGDEVDKMKTKDIALLERMPSVFARMSPHNKLKIVKALRKRGEVVAMTGDGVNDAPAISHADVAIAMGSATDLTKDCASIILVNNNFSSIVAAVEEGRRIYDNIQKFILYLLSCNSSEIYVMMMATFLGWPVPFTPVMILWANLIADVPPALALGIDPPEDGILNRGPRDPKTAIFTRATTAVVLFQGFMMSGITLGIYAIAIYVEGYRLPRGDETSRARGLAFVTLVMIQLIHAYLSRNIKESAFNRKIFANWWLNFGVFGSMLLLIGACYVPWVKDILGQHELNWLDWLQILACLAIYVIAVEIQKWVLRVYARRRRHQLGDTHSHAFFEDV